MKDISFIRGKCTRLCDTALTVKAKNRFLRDFPWMCFRSCDSVGPVHESVNQSGPNGGMAETDLWATQREEQEGDGRLQALRTSHRTGVCEQRRTEERCLQCPLIDLLWTSSLCGWRKEPCSGGETGSHTSGLMSSLPLSSSLAQMATRTAFYSFITIIMRRKRWEMIIDA